MAVTKRYDVKYFSKRLQGVMQTQGLNISEVARGCGTTRVCISHFVNGHRYPNMATAVKIANYLNVSFDDLLGVRKKEKSE